MPILFCSECNNLMNPKIENGDLMYVCVRCELLSEPTNPVLSQINFKRKHDTGNLQTSDLVHDVTLPRLNIQCEKCSNRECIGYMEKTEERALNFYYICASCHYEWTD